MAYLKLPFYKTGNYPNWNSPLGISRFADSTKTGNSTKLELHHMASLDLLICKSRKSTKLENKQSRSLQFSEVRNSTKHTSFAYSVQDF